uniref:Protein krueppel n=1 Tax=Anopheles christyi TaxID=43041 RepID=A0A182KAI5_9DIPT
MASIPSSSCRLCLNIPPTDSLVFSVFDTYQGKVLSQLIDELFDIKILEDDRLLSLCIECVNRINTVHKIKQLFVVNNCKLNELQQASPAPGSFVEELVYAVFTSSNEESGNIEDASLTNGVVAEQQEKPNAKEDGKPASDCCLSPDEDTFDVQATELYCDTDCKDGSAYKPANICRGSDTPEHKYELKTKESVNQLAPGKHAVKLPQNKCYFCATVFENTLQFTNHLPSHFNEVPYTCTACDGLVFKTVREASRHIGFHDARERPFQCRVCTLRFPTRNNSLTHERKLHRFKLKRMQEKANQRNGTSNRRSSGKGNTSVSRMKCITPKRKPPENECEICSKKFTEKKNLTRHLMIHTGEKPFKCDQCGCSYRQAGELKRHSSQHLGKKPTVATKREVDK